MYFGHGRPKVDDGLRPGPELRTHTRSQVSPLRILRETGGVYLAILVGRWTGLEIYLRSVVLYRRCCPSARDFWHRWLCEGVQQVCEGCSPESSPDIGGRGPVTALGSRGSLGSWIRFSSNGSVSFFGQWGSSSPGGCLSVDSRGLGPNIEVLATSKVMRAVSRIYSRLGWFPMSNPLVNGAISDTGKSEKNRKRALDES